MVVIFGSGKKINDQGSEKENGSQEKLRVPGSIPECEQIARNIFGNSSDIVIKTFDTVKEKAMLVYVDGMVNKDLIDRDIIRPLKSDKFDGNLSLALSATFTVTDDMHAFTEKVLTGEVGLFYGASGKVNIIEMRGWEHRSIEEPTSESVIRGPREGFTENITTNTAMIRRKIKTPALRFEEMTLGRQTRTCVKIVYIDGIANKEILEELKSRLSKIDVDSILESGQIEQLIDKNTFSTASGIGVTQKPDYLAERILEGRVAVLCDGTPHALTVPELFMDNLHTPEDRYNRTLYTNLLRIFRGLGLFITVIVPGLAVAIFTFNPEMLPSVFLVSVINSSIRTPLPFSLEILVLIVVFELVKEAGTRLPRLVGTAVTIVGSLIIGDVAVSSGIVSSPSLIIVAMSSIASFMLPNLSEYSSIYKLFFWGLGSTMGIVGIGVGIVIMMAQLISTESFGIPILSSFSKNEMKDSLLRFPLKNLIYRPTSIARENVKRKD